MSSSYLIAHSVVERSLASNRVVTRLEYDSEQAHPKPERGLSMGVSCGR